MNNPWLRHYPFDLYDKFVAWRELDAWERPLNCVLWIRRSKDDFTSGWAVVETGEIGLTVGALAPDGYAVLLHELAHMAAGKQETHGARWRALYLDAAEEVLGKKPHVRKLTQAGVDDAVLRGFCETR